MAAWADWASLENLRATLEAWGPLAPLIYVALVALEVIVAPLPGLLLYAPAGLIFGPSLGGTLSLIGNVIGATIACLLARRFGHRVADRLDASTLGPLTARLRARGGTVVMLLRLNPFTSTDLVSYAAGLVRIDTWRVTLGTAVGIAPLCYLQSYTASAVLTQLPAVGPIAVALGVIYLVVAAGVMVKALRAPRRHEQHRANDEAGGAGDRR